MERSLLDYSGNRGNYSPLSDGWHNGTKPLVVEYGAKFKATSGGREQVLCPARGVGGFNQPPIFIC